VAVGAEGMGTSQLSTHTLGVFVGRASKGFKYRFVGLEGGLFSPLKTSYKHMRGVCAVKQVLNRRRQILIRILLISLGFGCLRMDHKVTKIFGRIFVSGAGGPRGLHKQNESGNESERTRNN
jgi:hypothetical protein